MSWAFTLLCDECGQVQRVVVLAERLEQRHVGDLPMQPLRGADFHRRWHLRHHADSDALR